MKDKDKTQEQLISELEELRRRVARLEATGAERESVGEKQQEVLHFLQTLLDALPVPIFYKNVRGLYMGCNKAFEDYLGLSKENIVGKSVYDVAPKDLADKYHEMDAALFHQPGTQTYETSTVYADGSRHDVILNKATFADAEGTLAGLVGIMFDITERKQVEEALHKREREFRILIDTLNDGLGIQDEESVFVYANHKFCEMLGYPCDEVIGHSMKDFLDLIEETDQRTLKEQMAKRREGEQGSYEVSWTRRDGRRFSAIISSAPILSSDGHFKGAFSVVTDITERKLAEEALRESEERFRSIFEKAAVGIVMVDVKTGRHVKVNPAFQKMCGYSEQELLDMSPADISDSEDWSVESTFLEDLCAGKLDQYQTEKRYIQKKGELIWGCVTASVIHDASGHPDYTLSVIENITERKRVEKALLESEERYRLIFNHAPLGVMHFDQNGTIVDCNDKFVETMGSSREALIGFDMPESLRDEAMRSALLTSLSGRTGYYEGDYLSVTGKKLISVRCIFNRMTSEEGKFIGGVCISEDITQRKHAEEALERQKEVLQKIIDHIPVMLCFYDPSGHVRMINREFERLTGWPLEELREVEMMVELFPDAECRREACACMLKAEAGWQDFKIRIRNGEELNSCWAHVRLSDGSQIGIGIDISERKKAEEALEVYTAKLERSNQDLQDFASMASHDLREPLRKIQSFGERIKLRYSDCLDETGCDYLDRMLNGAERMQTLIQALLDYSMIPTQAQSFAPVDLTRLVREVVNDLEVRIEQTEGRVEVGALATIEANVDQMRQLFQNLIGNALKFHREEGPVVKVYGQFLKSQRMKTKETAGESYRIVIEDNGIGFDEKHLDRIFGPFQRLHGRSAYEGTGMGLAICRKVVERHGGSITAESTVGKGSRFIITLPVRQPRETTPSHRTCADEL